MAFPSAARLRPFCHGKLVCDTDIVQEETRAVGVDLRRDWSHAVDRAGYLHLVGVSIGS